MGNLRQRASGEVATRDNDRPDAAVVLREKITAMQDQFQMAMPKGVEATQLVRDAMTVLRQTPKLAECDPQSVLGALMTCAQLGLRVGVLGHAWVLPFYDWRSKGQKAQLIVGYQGLVELAHRSERIASLIARVVYERDEFDVAYGLEDHLVHKPYLGDDGRGDPIGYYAIVKLNTGGHAFIYMTKREAEDHREAHAMARKNPGKPNEKIVGPWVDNFDAMAMKTCVIKLAKWMPKSTDLARAIEADEGIRVDLTPTVPAEAATHHYRTDDTIDGVADEVEDPAPPAKKAAAKKSAAAKPATPSVTELHDKIAAAGQAAGMDAMALESHFAQQNADGDIREASVDQLGAFLQWVEAQAGQEPAAGDDEPPAEDQES